MAKFTKGFGSAAQAEEGDEGLRAGWLEVAIFLVLYLIFVWLVFLNNG